MDLINRDDVKIRLAELQKMSLKELQDLWREHFGMQPPTSGRTVFLRRRLAYRIQELYYGGISPDILTRIEILGKVHSPVCNSSGVIPGTRFEREWKGRNYIVVARENGFEFQRRVFRSLSGIANAITGTSWNGRKFFGLE